jgi:hypothetical protein
VIASRLIVSGAVPLDVIVRGWVVVDPSCVEPKFSVVAESTSFGAGSGTPFPVRATLVAAPLALLFTVRSPVTAPVAVGRNATFNVICCPGLSVAGSPVVPGGKEEDAIPNWAPAIAVDEIVTGAVPEEVSVTCKLAWVFTWTSPKSRLATLMVNAGDNAAVPKPVSETLNGDPVSVWSVSFPEEAPAVTASNETAKLAC